MPAKRTALWVAAVVLVVVAAIGITSCGSDNNTTSTSSATAAAGGGGEDRAAAPGDEDGSLRDAGQAAVRGEGQGARARRRDPVQQRQPGRGAAAVAGRRGADQRRARCSCSTRSTRRPRLDRDEGGSRRRCPVISYDRLILNAAGRLLHLVRQREGRQAAGPGAARQADGKDGNAGKTIVMINGSPTDNNATLFKKGAHSVLDGKVKIGAEYDTPDWSPDKAQTEMDQAITKLGKDGFVGVYCANDGTGGGAIAAMKGAGIDPKTRPTTGQDAELAAIQRILLGEQYMTVYKAIKLEAEAAAELAVALAKGEGVPSSMTLTQGEQRLKDVASVLLTPVAVTKDNIKDTVVADGFWTAAADHEHAGAQGGRRRPSGCSERQLRRMNATSAAAPLALAEGREQGVRREPGPHRRRLRSRRR